VIPLRNPLDTGRIDTEELQRAVYTCFVKMARAPSAPSYTSCVIVNGVELNQSEIQILQAAIGPVYPGSYWYDPRCGAFGLIGGPCRGVLPGGPALGGGQLARNASGNTGTGVFINGREIHSMDVSALQGMGVTVLPGSWWVNADGTYGMEGSPFPLGNLRLQAMATKNSSGGDHTWQTSMGHHGGSDGQGFWYVGGPGWTVYN